MRIKCNICGKDVSTDVPDWTMVRAWIECPECSDRCCNPPKWDPDHDQNDVCKCGHIYYRHFDSYDDHRGVGCKYCECEKFEDKQ